MKKIVLTLLAGVTLLACTDGNNDNNTKCVTLDFEGAYWDALVDTPQYGGELLYGGGGYGWYDENTDLASELTDLYEDNKLWGGGVAISSYFSTDYKSANTANEQLTVFTAGAHSGRNCSVCHGYNIYGDSRSYIYFKEEPRYIDGAWVAHTTYSYAMATDGESGTYPIPALIDESIWIEATGYVVDEEGNEVESSSLKFYLYRDGKQAFEGWSKWDMSPLGKVKRVRFDLQWNGEGVFPHPAYFALDDITVVK